MPAREGTPPCSSQTGQQRRETVWRYLAGRLRDLGVSRRLAVLVMNPILDGTIHPLRRGRKVKWPSGFLKRAERHCSEHWDSAHESLPNRSPHHVEHELAEEGDELGRERGRLVPVLESAALSHHQFLSANSGHAAGSGRSDIRRGNLRGHTADPGHADHHGHR